MSNLVRKKLFNAILKNTHYKFKNNLSKPIKKMIIKYYSYKLLEPTSNPKMLWKTVNEISVSMNKAQNFLMRLSAWGGGSVKAVVASLNTFFTIVRANLASEVQRPGCLPLADDAAVRASLELRLATVSTTRMCSVLYQVVKYVEEMCGDSAARPDAFYIAVLN